MTNKRGLMYPADVAEEEHAKYLKEKRRERRKARAEKIKAKQLEVKQEVVEN